MSGTDTGRADAVDATAAREYTTGGDDDAVVDSLRGAGEFGPAQAMASLLPQVRIVHGDPDAEELAALVAGLLATHAAARAADARTQRPSAPRRGCWSDKAARLGVVRPGPGAWGSWAR